MELPETRRNRFRNEYRLSCIQAEFLCDDKERADFFEAAVKQGASAQTAERWISSEVTRLLNKNNMRISEMQLTPTHYASIIKKIDAGKIHSVFAKQLIQASFATGASPEKLLKSLDVTEISDPKKLLPFVKKIIATHSDLCARLTTGDMAPLEFLTGEVMKATKQKAVPQVVKSLIKKELDISVVYILAMGGAISATRHENGTLASGNATILRSMANKRVPHVPVQVVSLGQFLSEEIEPDDWAVLIAEIAKRIHAGIANGIVITHGRDTLSYTAALLFWLFSDAHVPIVLTASSHAPSESDEAEKNLALAVNTAVEKKNRCVCCI
ncbi:MAG: asparaginase [Treponema sp.]|nr:asparaginase [Treponema sp.]